MSPRDSAEKTVRIAAVIQRYGSEVVGGESLCRHVMEQLARSFDVTVLTTCARDYTTWADFYPAGEREENGVRILRFPVAGKRPMRRFHLLSRVLLSPLYRNRMPRLLALEERWVELQGPVVPGLLDHLRDHATRYDAIFFYTYLYFPTVRGLPLAAERSVLVPFAHDEGPIYLLPYRRVFSLPRAFLFLSAEEQQLVNRLFDLGSRPQKIASMKVPTIDDLDRDEEELEQAVRAFRRRYGLYRPYLLFLGRLDVAKGSEWLFSHFIRYRKESDRDFDLVLAGNRHVAVPKHPNIRYLGFLKEEEKQLALLGCRFFVLPSPLESFSISLLEALGMKRPALVNSASPVLRGHIERSGAGYAVADYPQFREAADRLFSTDHRRLGEKGLRYVRKNFPVERTEQIYGELIRWMRTR